MSSIVEIIEKYRIIGKDVSIYDNAILNKFQE